MWRVKSFQSASAASAFDLNDASYSATIEDSNRMQIMPTIKSAVITRGQYSPTIVGVNREMDKAVVTVSILAANWRTALKNLSAACPNDELETGTLTVTDETATEWTIQARVSNLMRTKFAKVYELHLDVPDLIWRKVATADTWSVTSTNDDEVITNTGNRKLRPVFKFKPTAIKANGFLYRWWIPVRNPNTDRGFSNKGLELTDGGLDTRTLVKDTTHYMQINDAAGIDATQTTIPYDTKTEGVAGRIGTYGIGYIDNGAQVEQICWTGRTGTTSGNLTGVTRAVGGTTARIFADDVKIYLSYAQADGSDVRIYKNSLEQNSWISGFNTADTRIWIVASEPAGVNLTLGAAIANSGTVDEIEFKATVANRTALSRLPTSGVIRINDEAFHYTDRDYIRLTMDIDARAINGTSMGAHTVNDNVYWLANDYWMYAGNPFLDAQETSDTRKPVLEHASSDNETRNYATFGSASGLRADSWVPRVEASSYPAVREASKFYGGNQMDDSADPYTEMGMLMQSIYLNGTWRYESGRVTWTIYEPAGIYRVVEWIYEKYRTGASYPVWVRLEKSKDGMLWANVASVTSPSSASSWGSPTTAGPYVMGTGYYYLRVIFYGTQAAGQSGGAGYLSAFEVNSLKYETVAPLIPEIMDMQAGSYEHNFIVRNTTNSQFFRVIFTDALNGEIEVDCEAKTFTTLADGKKHRAAIFVPNTQADWMTLDAGANTLRHIESGVTGLTTTVTHEDLLAV